MLNQRYRVFTVLAIVTICMGFFFTPNLATLMQETWDVITHHGVLITDLMAIGLGGSFINAGMITLILLWAMRRVESEMNGLDIAALLTVYGFAFFGKTLLAVWPPFLGVILMAKLRKQDLKAAMPVAMFATAAAPAIAVTYYTMEALGWGGILLAIVVGLGIGMAIQVMAAKIKALHNGLILYNIGFTLGFVLLFLFSLVKAFGFTISSNSGEILVTNQFPLVVLLVVVFVIFIVYGYLLSGKSKTSVLNTSELGDYVNQFGYGETLINVGVLGLLSTALVLVCQGTINGPNMAGILTVAGFGAFGKTLRNIVPLVLGAMLMVVLTKGWVGLSQAGPMITILFATGLAPVTKRYGFFGGVFFGMTHIIIVANTGVLHGYMSLYNNAFAMGMVAMLLKPIADEVCKCGDTCCCAAQTK
ncbi:MAG: DUF1576 domain-containing protein [Erysipelotrichaceae bacterium]